MDIAEALLVFAVAALDLAVVARGVRSDKLMITFCNRLCTARDHLTNAINVEADHDVAEYVVKVVGDEFEVPPKSAANKTIKSARAHCFG